MKKIVSIILVLSMIASLGIAMGVSAAYTPEGTAITNAAEFAAMTVDGKYYLSNDITIDATYAETFAGTLDGNGKTITTSVPVFATLGSATVKNLKLAGEINISEAVDAGVLTVTVAGASNLVIDNVENNCKLTVAAKKDVGGFIGVMGYGGCYGTTITIKNSTNNGDITGGWRVGGFIGYMPGSDKEETPFTVVMDNCVNNGTIASTESYSGGFIGRFGGVNVTTGKCSMTIKNSTNNGVVSAAVSQVGGFAGYVLGKLIVEYSVNNANLTATEGNNMQIGGIIGVCGAETNYNCDGAIVRYCINNGKISTTSKAGGIVSNLGNSKATQGACLVENCINFGEITVENCVSSGTTYAGGIAGYMYGGSGEGSNTIRNCLNLGNITGTTTAASGKNYAGGILAYVNGKGITVANNLNLGNITLVSETTNAKFTHTFFNNRSTDSAEACANNYSVAQAGITLLDFNGVADPCTTVITAADAALVEKLGAAWKMGDKNPEPIIEGTVGGTGADFSIFVEVPETTAPETTEPAPETTEPAPETTEPGASEDTGDSAIIFAVLAVIAVAGVAVVSKKKEN